MRDFVTVKGSAYFFLPGRRAVRYLSALAASTVAARPEGKALDPASAVSP